MPLNNTNVYSLIIFSRQIGHFPLLDVVFLECRKGGSKGTDGEFGFQDL